MLGTATIIEADCLTWMREQPENSVNLVFGSPPYEAARTYGIDFKLRGQDWVDWMVERMAEMVRISSGLVAMVVEGQTRDFRWSAAPILLMADLHRRGICLRKPPAFRRVGIPGSGGPDWLRNDYEFIVCCTSGGKLPWSDNTTMGKPPKFEVGGAMSYRNGDGVRKNARGYSGQKRDRFGFTEHDGEPSQTQRANGAKRRKMQTRRKANGERPGRKVQTLPRDGMHNQEQDYTEPAIANPGNVIQQTYTAKEVADLLGETHDVIDCIVGGGVMGDELCHENEAPFPESLAEFFIRSFCHPGGTVLDPFSGSGTTAAVAVRLGRKAIGIDIRDSQVDLSRRRVSKVQPEMFA